MQHKYIATPGALASFSNVETWDRPKLKAKLSVDIGAIQEAEAIREIEPEVA